MTDEEIKVVRAAIVAHSLLIDQQEMHLDAEVEPEGKELFPYWEKLREANREMCRVIPQLFPPLDKPT